MNRRLSTIVAVITFSLLFPQWGNAKDDLRDNIALRAARFLGQ